MKAQTGVEQCTVEKEVRLNEHWSEKSPIIPNGCAGKNGETY